MSDDEGCDDDVVMKQPKKAIKEAKTKEFYLESKCISSNLT